MPSTPAITPISTTPAFPTQTRKRLTGGRLMGVDGSLWLYRAVPMAPVLDARDSASLLEANRPIAAAIDELAGLATPRIARRSMSRGSYRRIHILAVDIPRSFQPPADHPDGGRLRADYAEVTLRRRVLLFGVRLTERLGGDAGISEAVRSVAETLTVGGAPISDYDPDVEVLDALCARVGMRVPTDEEVRIANAWWNYGWTPEVIDLEHLDHLHVFASADSARAAARLGEGSCEDFEAMGDHASLSFGAVEDFLIPFFGLAEDDPSAAWCANLIAAGATAVSIRGLCEPPAVTRGELRRHRKKFLDDLTERANSRHGALSRSEQEETIAELTEMEGLYATGGPATLVDASVVVAFSGVGERGYDLSEIGASAGVRLAPMARRQRGAWAETMLCSPVLASPYLHDLPSHMVAAAGMTSLSIVGDRPPAAVFGFTENDRQPAWISPVAASNSDALPLFVCAGATGSGKAQKLSTRVPTPSGWTTIGALRIGDQIFGRDGRVHNVVFLSGINPRPELYEVVFSDGQTVSADINHQWVVSSFYERNYVRTSRHLDAIERHRSAHLAASRLEALSSTFAPDEELTIDDLHGVVRAALPDLASHWPSRASIYASLSFVDCPYRIDRLRVPRKNPTQVVKTDPVVLFPFRGTLEANAERWRSVTGTNATRWSRQLESKLAATARLTALMDRGLLDSNEEITVAELARRLRSEGAELPQSSCQHLAKVAREAGVLPRRGRARVVIDIPVKDGETTRPKAVYPVAVALKSLAERLRQRYDTSISAVAEERVLTTGEMLAEGIRTNGGAARFAVRLAKPLHPPSKDLPVDPYVLGVWLGDGSKDGGQITQGHSDACTDPMTGTTDQDHLLAELRAVGIECSRGSGLPGNTINTRGLKVALRQLGVLGAKHIPMEYLRASRSQRLALLQGLMDSDGHVGPKGQCSIDFTDEVLARATLELVRSLGVKASMTAGPAAITERDVSMGGTRRRQTGTRWRTHFTTAEKVFRLPRKARCLPSDVRETQGWLYVVDIRPVDPEPVRCIQVDSPDGTYLVEGFIPTHNTLLMQLIATQFASLPTAKGERTPVVILDPKNESDLSPAIEMAGGRTASLDDIATGDGIYDPLRFSTTPEAAIDLATSLLLQINPWGSAAADWETPLSQSIAFGVERGATCIGEALDLAARAGTAPKEMVERVFALSSSPLFRACVGFEPGGAGLRLSEGITYIRVGGTYLDLPAPGAASTTQPQRISAALVRMMVFGSAMALSGRQGVIMLDEAWVFLGSGRSEVERLGRLARSQQVLPMMFTQRVTDALDAGLAGAISRGMVMSLNDESEARAALELFKLEPTPARLARITARDTVGSTDGQVAPNWESYKALRDWQTGKVLRGAIGIYVDLFGRAVPVEVVIPPRLFLAASTNPEDVRRREAQRAAKTPGAPVGQLG